MKNKKKTLEGLLEEGLKDTSKIKKYTAKEVAEIIEVQYPERRHVEYCERR